MAFSHGLCFVALPGTVPYFSSVCPVKVLGTSVIILPWSHPLHRCPQRPRDLSYAMWRAWWTVPKQGLAEHGGECLLLSCLNPVDSRRQDASHLAVRRTRKGNIWRRCRAAGPLAASARGTDTGSPPRVPLHNVLSSACNQKPDSMWSRCLNKGSPELPGRARDRLASERCD